MWNYSGRDMRKSPDAHFWNKITEYSPNPLNVFRYAGCTFRMHGHTQDNPVLIVETVNWDMIIWTMKVIRRHSYETAVYSELQLHTCLFFLWKNNLLSQLKIGCLLFYFILSENQILSTGERTCCLFPWVSSLHWCPKVIRKYNQLSPCGHPDNTDSS